MQQLVKLFWDICLLRKGPQDVPPAYILFWFLLPVGLMVDFIITVNFIDLQQALLLVVVNTALLFAVVILILVTLGYANRITQTLTTLIGTGLVFSFIRLPIIFVIKLAPQNAAMLGFLEITVLVWSLVVIAHILRYALSIQLFLAGALAFGYFVLSYQLVSYLIPQAV